MVLGSFLLPELLFENQSERESESEKWKRELLLAGVILILVNGTRVAKPAHR